MKTNKIRNHAWRPWTEAEDAILDRLYPDHGPEPVARETGRSISSVDEHARRRGVKKKRSVVEPAQDLATVWLRRAWTLTGE